MKRARSTKYIKTRLTLQHLTLDKGLFVTHLMESDGRFDLYTALKIPLNCKKGEFTTR